MAAAKLLIDRVIPSRRGAPVSFHIRPLKTPDDCALAYADLLDDVGAVALRRRRPRPSQPLFDDVGAVALRRRRPRPSQPLSSSARTSVARYGALVGPSRSLLQHALSKRMVLSGNTQTTRLPLILTPLRLATGA